MSVLKFLELSVLSNIQSLRIAMYLQFHEFHDLTAFEAQDI